MNLVQVTDESIVIGQPLPFALRDETGVLLARKGYVIGSRGDLDAMRGRGHGFYVDVSESSPHHRAYVGKLMDLVNDDQPLRRIAEARLTTRDLVPSRDNAGSEAGAWMDLQERGNRLLRDLNTTDFPDDLERLHVRLRQQAMRNADGALFALMHLSARDLDLYSATHAMLVSVICGLVARDVLEWPERQEETLCKAALTMNIGMTVQQDRLAAQHDPPTREQRRLIEEHPRLSVEALRRLGLHDPQWLEAVRDHHTAGPGELAPREPAQQMARIIRRADLYAARLAPRANRRPDPASAAMQACYRDENRQIDAAGAAVIRVVGVYPPASLVRLSNQETAIVVRRGVNSATPRVALLINRDGFATSEPVLRDTNQREFRIAASLAPHECKVRISLERMLPLTSGPTSSRTW